MIEKTISTEHGDVLSTAEVLHTDNGQVLLHITSKLGDARHEHRVTVGAEDGNDLVASCQKTNSNLRSKSIWMRSGTSPRRFSQVARGSLASLRC
jgi:hypothetical protein